MCCRCTISATAENAMTIPTRKIYLALQVKADDAAFDDLGDIIRTDEGLLFSTYKTGSQAVHDYILAAIADGDKDLLIGDLSPALGTLITVAETTTKTHAVIESIFIPSEKRRAIMLKDALSLNRWMDFPPGHIETVHAANGKKLAEIKNYFLSAGIKMVEV